MKKIGLLMISLGIICVLVSACMSDNTPEMPINIIVYSVILGIAITLLGYFIVCVCEKAQKKSAHCSKAISTQSDHQYDQQLH